MRVFCKLFFLSSLWVAVSCGGRSSGQTENRPFPYPEVPRMIIDVNAGNTHYIQHYWDGYLEIAEAVDETQLQMAMSKYATMLAKLPVEESCKYIETLADNMEEILDSLQYNRLAGQLQFYFYDPNSPLRDEDLYGTFASKRAESRYTAEDMREAHKADAALCSINRRGTKATDFAYCTAQGKKSTLHSLKAEYTLLFFSNPGCPNCREIQEKIENTESLSELQSSGRLVVLSVYPDEDLQAWREYLSHYPKEWIVSYNPDAYIRNNQTYSLRAIPSLYLLDKEKLVIFKDATESTIINYLRSI